MLIVRQTNNILNLTSSPEYIQLNARHLILNNRNNVINSFLPSLNLTLQFHTFECHHSYRTPPQSVEYVFMAVVCKLRLKQQSIKQRTGHIPHKYSCLNDFLSGDTIDYSASKRRTEQKMPTGPWGAKQLVICQPALRTRVFLMSYRHGIMKTMVFL